MKKYPFISYHHATYSNKEMEERSKTFYAFMQKRRSVRMFSSDPIPDEVIKNIIMTASTAPSGANKQPWTYCIVTNQELKHAIRMAAEKEEKESYDRRMPADWLEDLAPLGTDWHKEFLEIAPVLIVVFKRNYEIVDGRKKNNYYVSESVGLSCGMLLAAIHNAGLIALTHTPSPMNFLKELLKRPENESPYLLIPVGKPHPETTVPDIQRKKMESVMITY
ncbi:MAG: nitroreductase family protein [Chitinophagales bacterium]|nr:nitroreductase family protein [Bacteroidota bacterium]MBP7399289.1 nitroreductase family protein [Chitinophagales bacterium]MBP8754031.1 nitroreductase family protein [Chitinophagales bacterium]MBP9189093.1 nitroreductase family protein [Chitinophagales bacterium]MBP9548759.1 nitroreductase family protein [Chitinophagales bacterium]